MLIEENPLERLIGTYCIKAYNGYAGSLKIFCSKYPDMVTLLINNMKEPELEFKSVSAAWRLKSNESLKAGSYQEIEYNDRNLKELVGKRILQVSQVNKTEISIIFEDGYLIETFNQGLDHPPIEFIDLTKHQYLELSQSGTWSKWKENEGLNNDEKVVNQHSENTYHRWKDIVPAESTDNHCRNCSYFLPNSGRFYFWDFGLCSNKKSYYDGKVVGVKSTCEYYDNELRP